MPKPAKKVPRVYLENFVITGNDIPKESHKEIPEKNLPAVYLIAVVILIAILVVIFSGG